MPFTQGSVTFQRFQSDANAEGFGEDDLHRLAEATKSSQLIVVEGATIDWSAGESVLDTDFQLAKNIFVDHLLFDFRTQTDRMPSDLLKAYYTAELKALSANNPSGHPSARQKREAKEAARDRLEQEAKDGRFRKRKCIPVLWDRVTNQVLFGSTSASAQQKFMRLFEQTFKTTIQPVTAGRLCGPLGAEDFSPPPSTYVPGMEVREVYWSPDEKTPDWLGNEFIIWLWWTYDVKGDTIDHADGDIAFFFSGGGKLDCPRGVTGNDTLNHDSFVRMREAKAALRSGKWPRQVALTLVRHSEQYSLKLQAEQFSVTSGKLPNISDDIVESHARVVERLKFIRDLVKALDDLYESFLDVRMDGHKWKLELSMIQDWIAKERKAA
jgi:hypothetical protein